MTANEDWKDDLRSKLEGFVNTFVVAGVCKEEVLNEIRAALKIAIQDAQMNTPPINDQDSRSLEPANDWPGAESD